MEIYMSNGERVYLYTIPMPECKPPKKEDVKMKSYWNKEEVLKVLGYYDLSGEVYRDLLSLDTYIDTDEVPNSAPTTNINFFCGKEKVEDMIEKIAKNNDGKISIIKGE